jgi:hypothetical protein
MFNPGRKGTVLKTDSAEMVSFDRSLLKGEALRFQLISLIPSHVGGPLNVSATSDKRLGM